MISHLCCLDKMMKNDNTPITLTEITHSKRNLAKPPAITLLHIATKTIATMAINKIFINPSTNLINGTKTV